MKYNPHGNEKYPSPIHPVESGAIKIVTKLARKAMSTEEQELAINIVENMAGITSKESLLLDDENYDCGGC